MSLILYKSNFKSLKDNMALITKKIAVKIGSNVLTRSDGRLDVTRMSALVDQIAELRKANVEVVLISSGAVASGRNELHSTSKPNSVAERQLFAAVGQAKLIDHYYKLFKEYGISVGQILTTRENFERKELYQNQKRCMNTMLRHKVIPIVNENDTVSVNELMFTDNDELSGLIATMLKVDVLILLTNVDGVYTASPSSPDAQLLRELTPESDLSQYLQVETSLYGRGGMVSKVHTAQQLAASGVTVFIANGKRNDILTNLLFHAEDVPFTRFQTSKQL